MSFASALSEPLRGLSAVRALERSLARGRLAHALLLHGDRLEVLQEVALALAGELLGAPGRAESHPDLFVLRPARKGRQIRISGEAGKLEPNTMRWLLRQVQQTANQGGRKVAIVAEVDRLNDAAANAFLKTLEEPPADTTLLLLTTRPYDLLPTIRSRCLQFRLPALVGPPLDPDWAAWLAEYRDWLGRVARRPEGKTGVAQLVFTAYGLAARFGGLLEDLTERAWREEKARLEESLDPEEAEALEAGLRKGLRTRRWADLEQATRDHGLAHPGGSNLALTQSIAELERLVGLLEVNLKEESALELFLLFCLRAWSRP